MRKKGTIVKLLWATAIAITILFMLAVAAFLMLQTDSVQQRLLSYTTSLLSQELHTKVDIDKVSLSLKDRDVRLYGVTVEDLQQRKMLQVEELGVRMKLRPLLHRSLQLTESICCCINRRPTRWRTISLS